jgi:hypothetical protein
MLLPLLLLLLLSFFTAEAGLTGKAALSCQPLVQSTHHCPCRSVFALFFPLFAAEAGLTGKAAKLRSKALTEQLKALSRSQARGGLQPYRHSSAAVGGAVHHQQQQQGGGAMTAEQQREQAEMEAELEQVRRFCMRSSRQTPAP